MDKPARRFHVTLELHGMDRPALAQALQAISWHLRAQGMSQDYEGFDADYVLRVTDDKDPRR